MHKVRGLLTGTDLSLDLLTCGALLMNFSGHSCGARGWPDGETLVCGPGFEDTANNVESARLCNSAAAQLAAADADVDDALECEREKVGTGLG